MDYTFSDSVKELQPSLIREFFKYNGVPGYMPFSAGNPASETFPVEDIKRITAEILEESPIAALQYGITEGFPPLRESLGKLSAERYGIGADFDELIVTSGSQQTMYLTAKVLLNPGDTVICESPSFVGSLNSFRSFGARLRGVEMEGDGMRIDELEAALKSEKNVRFIYTIPNFQNPSGQTTSLEKRKAIYDLAEKYGVLVLEDNPYGELRVAGEELPCIKSFDKSGLVIYAGSFSKVLSPGMRLGWCVAPKPVIAKMTVGKQVSDVNSVCLTQMVLDRWLRTCDFASHIENLRAVYRHKLSLMCDLIEEKLGSYLTYTRPEGGLFVWCRLNDNIPMRDFCVKAVENKVTIVPGSAFMTDDSVPTQCFRANFSTPSDDQIRKGIDILADLAATY